MWKGLYRLERQVEMRPKPSKIGKLAKSSSKQHSKIGKQAKKTRKTLFLIENEAIYPRGQSRRLLVIDCIRSRIGERLGMVRVARKHSTSDQERSHMQRSHQVLQLAWIKSILPAKTQLPTFAHKKDSAKNRKREEIRRVDLPAGRIYLAKRRIPKRSPAPSKCN